MQDLCIQEFIAVVVCSRVVCARFECASVSASV